MPSSVPTMKFFSVGFFGEPANFRGAANVSRQLARISAAAFRMNHNHGVWVLPSLTLLRLQAGKSRWVGQNPYAGIGMTFFPVFSATYCARLLSGPNSTVSESRDLTTSTAFALVQHTSASALQDASVLT